MLISYYASSIKRANNWPIIRTSRLAVPLFSQCQSGDMSTRKNHFARGNAWRFIVHSRAVTRDSPWEKWQTARGLPEISLCHFFHSRTFESSVSAFYSECHRGDCKIPQRFQSSNLINTIFAEITSLDGIFSGTSIKEKLFFRTCFYAFFVSVFLPVYIDNVLPLCRVQSIWSFFACSQPQRPVSLKSQRV